MVTNEAAMSFSQFGYPYNATSQFFVSANPSTTCCDSISRSVTEGNSGSQPAAAATFCCPSYENRLLASTRTELNAALGMYSSPYSQNYANYFPYSSEPSAIYSTLNPQYEIKDGSATLHSGITQPAAYYPYDHPLSHYQYDRYGSVDFNGSARRKNATRETTSTLKTWLYEHRKNPYPTKGEKIMLAIITKMTLTQVSTWFANARRRLKKENKMTWSPKSKAGDERKDELDKSDQDCVTKDSSSKEESELRLSDLDDLEDDEDLDRLDSDGEKAEQEQELHRAAAGAPPKRAGGGPEVSFHPFPCSSAGKTVAAPSDFPDPAASKSPPSSSSSSKYAVPAGAVSLSHFHVSTKPRIWSLARTAATGGALGPQRGAERRTEGAPGGECQLQSARPPGTSVVGQCGAPRGLQDPTSLVSIAENPFQEGPTLHSKLYSAAGSYNHKALQLHCSSYPALSDTCQYSTIEGFSSRKAQAVLSELSDTCVTLQDDKAFRPVMKRLMDTTTMDSGTFI